MSERVFLRNRMEFVKKVESNVSECYIEIRTLEVNRVFGDIMMCFVFLL